MDFELEMAFLVGTGCQLGESIDVNNAQGIIYQCFRSNSFGFQGLIWACLKRKIYLVTWGETILSYTCDSCIKRHVMHHKY